MRRGPGQRWVYEPFNAGEAGNYECVPCGLVSSLFFLSISYLCFHFLFCHIFLFLISHASGGAKRGIGISFVSSVPLVFNLFVFCIASFLTPFFEFMFL